ncbi:MAG TPA: hypothetical protein VKU82_14715 [Planctomycetaceae bacterium]|nr:hypothetical protein [Planctomycetaceae bacterium]
MSASERQEIGCRIFPRALQREKHSEKFFCDFSAMKRFLFSNDEKSMNFLVDSSAAEDTL